MWYRSTIIILNNKIPSHYHTAIESNIILNSNHLLLPQLYPSLECFSGILSIFLWVVALCLACFVMRKPICLLMLMLELVIIFSWLLCLILVFRGCLWRDPRFLQKFLLILIYIFMPVSMLFTMQPSLLSSRWPIPYPTYCQQHRLEFQIDQTP